MKKLVTLLLALLLSLSLTVPALAAVKIIILKDETLSGEHTYNDMVMMAGNTTVEKNAVITFNQKADVSGSLMVEAGATVTTNKNMFIGEKVTVGGKLKGKGCLSIANGNISLLPGGEIDIVLDYKDQANELVSKLLENGEEKVSVNKEQTKDGYHVTAHGHDFEDGVCAVCGVSAPTASILSDGNLWIILAVALAAAAAVVIVLVVMKKKSEGK